MIQSPAFHRTREILFVQRLPGHSRLGSRNINAVRRVSQRKEQVSFGDVAEEDSVTPIIDYREPLVMIIVERFQGFAQPCI